MKQRTVHGSTNFFLSKMCLFIYRINQRILGYLAVYSGGSKVEHIVVCPGGRYAGIYKYLRKKNYFILTLLRQSNADSVSRCCIPMRISAQSDT